MTKLDQWIALSLSALMLGCGCARDVKTPVTANPVEPRKSEVQKYSYSTNIANQDREAAIATLKSQVTEKSSEMRKLNAAIASLEVARQLQSPSARLEGLENESKLKADGDLAIKTFVHEIVQTQQLIALLNVDNEGVDQLADTIRDAYSKHLGNMYEISYINELLAGRVHKRAEMLALEMSDHALAGIRSRHSSEHVIKTSRELIESRIAIIVAELLTEVSPSKTP